MAFSLQRPLQSAVQSRGKGVDLAPPVWLLFLLLELFIPVAVIGVFG